MIEIEQVRGALIKVRADYKELQAEMEIAEELLKEIEIALEDHVRYNGYDPAFSPLLAKLRKRK